MRKRSEERAQEERDKSRRPVLYALSIVLLAIITVAFVGTPVVSRWRAAARLDFGSYAGRHISYVSGNYFAAKYSEAAEAIRSSGQEANLESQLYQAWRYAFDQTVLHTAILLEMERSGAWVSDDRVSDSLVEYGPYVVGGTFSKARYDATPQVERVAIRKLRREELLHDRYLADMFATPKISEAERRFIADMASIERRYALAAYKFSDLPASRVLAYGLEHEKQFRKMKLSRITVLGSRRTAEQIRGRLGQRSFEELARSYSKDPYAEKGGDAGYVFYHELQALFGKDGPVEAVFALREGEVSDVFEAAAGSWVFFRADSQVIEPDLSQAETLDAIRRYILSSEVGVAESYFLEEGRRLAAAAREKGFNRALADAKMFPPLETEFTPLNYANVLPSKRLRLKGDDQSLLAGAAYDEEFWRALAALRPGQVSEPLLLGDRVVVVTPLEERTLAEAERQAVESAARAFALQALQQELPGVLIDDKQLVDRFQETFFTKILGRAEP